MDTERQNLPSASAVSRLAACPGSKKLCANAPALPSDPDAERGTRIHKALETGDPSQLEFQEQVTYADCIAQELEAMGQMWPGPHDGPAPKDYREERLWLTTPNFEEYFSAKLDVFYVWQNEALIIDFKSMWGDHDRPALNEQLRAQVVCLWNRYRKTVTRIRVVLAQPNRKAMAPADYNLDDIHKADVWLHGILAEANMPDAPLKTGPHCRYCAARTICPALGQAVESLVEKHRWEVASPQERAARIPLLQLGIKMATEELKAYKEALRTDPNFVDGYWIKPGRVDHPITDLTELYRRVCVQNNLITPEEFLACCKVTKGELETRLGAACESKGHKLKDVLPSLYAGVTGSKQADGSLAEKE